MHSNFYHWHNRVEIKPDTAILEPRWNAAVKVTKKPNVADIRSLLRLVLFSETDPEFAKRFSDGILKAEPTFPPSNNSELLRVMAAAAVYSHMETSSTTADALALGLRAADFPVGRLEPVCQDVMARAEQYLVDESERIRPQIYSGVLADSEKQIETLLTALKKAVESNAPAEIGKATEAAERGVFTAVKESHRVLGDVISRMAEESQFLWWLLGRNSPTLKARRENLTAECYALPLAAEAADRVNVLPPPSSIESLLEEVLSQCGKNGTSGTVADTVMAADAEWIKGFIKPPTPAEMVPIASLAISRLVYIRV